MVAGRSGPRARQAGGGRLRRRCRYTAPMAATTAPTLGSQLRLAVLRLSRRLRQQTAGEITASQLSALTAVAKHGELSLGELAAIERIAPPSMTRIAVRLEEQGLLERARRHGRPARGPRRRVAGGGGPVGRDPNPPRCLPGRPVAGLHRRGAGRAGQGRAAPGAPGLRRRLTIRIRRPSRPHHRRHRTGRDTQHRLRLGDDFVRGDIRRHLDECQPVGGDIDDRQVGDDPVHHVLAGQRQ